MSYGRLTGVFFCFTLLCVSAPLDAADASSDGVWTRISLAELESHDASGLTPWIQPQSFQAARLSATGLQQILDRAPMEGSDRAGTDPVLLKLPTPDGFYETFEIVISPVMEIELEAWMASQGWPMRTYRGVSLDHPATSVRLDWGGPAGFHASVLSPGRSYYVDPYWQGDTDHYTSYSRSGYVRDHQFECLVKDEKKSADQRRAGSSTNGNLRTYRLAMAATGEYTAFHGGTVALGQAAIVTTVNRVNQVYENDLSIRMTLVANNNLIVYTNAITDPYTNNNGSAMLGENQTNVDLVIGTANYDIGHVVSTGGGGIASLGVPCNSSFKARGVTGLSNPIGDPFDIDFVAHEMGHQWDGRHTFNSVTSGCGGNRSASTAYEPGSGSTIQAYAGLCGADNLQNNSDPYFHGISLDEMLNYSAGSGACSVNTAANPNAPTVNAGLDYTIPVSTPFELTVASANDADGDPLTFTWEQFDLGPALTLAAGDNGLSPIFRSWSPTSETTQRFPNNGATTAPGEVLPTTIRDMTFRVTARDNRPGAGRVGEDETVIDSTTSAGPFLVTAPNGGESWDGTQTVTWNVAGTTGGGVDTSNVAITLSTDGGQTFPTTLLASTPNDGSQAVTLPAVDTSAARIKIKGVGNVFYDMSDGNFSIGTVQNQTLYDQSANCDLIGGSPSQYFPDFAAGLDMADDFTVPTGQQWTLGNVSVRGVFQGGDEGPLQSVNAYVFTNSAGLPGTAVSGCSFSGIAPVGGLLDADISVDVPGTCVLDPGTYWIEVQAVMPFVPNGQWFWTRNSGSFGATFAFRDSNDLLGLGCTVWGAGTGCLGAPDPDLCFTISGSPGGGADLIFEDGFESGNTSFWSNTFP